MAGLSPTRRILEAGCETGDSEIYCRELNTCIPYLYHASFVTKTVPSFVNVLVSVVHTSKA